MNRLTSVGLDHLAIDLHGADLSPKKVMEQVAKTLTLVRDAIKPSVDGVHGAFTDRRSRLNQHDERVHRIHQPTGLSVFQMQGHILRLPPSANSPIRWRGPELASITSDKAKEIRDLLGEASGFSSLFNLTDSSPWCGIKLPNTQSAQKALDVICRLAHEELPPLIEALGRVAQNAGLRTAATMAEAGQLVAMAASSNQILSKYQGTIFPEAASLLQSMALGQAKGLKGLWVRITNGRYKQAMKKALLLRTSGKASKSQIWNDVDLAARVIEFWQRGLLANLYLSLSRAWICASNYANARRNP